MGRLKWDEYQAQVLVLLVVLSLPQRSSLCPIKGSHSTEACTADQADPDMKPQCNVSFVQAHK